MAWPGSRKTSRTRSSWRSELYQRVASCFVSRVTCDLKDQFCVFVGDRSMLANLSNGRWHKSGKWGRSSVSGELDFDRTADKVLAKFSSVHLAIRTRLIGWFLGGKSALSVGLNSFRNTQHSCALLCTRTSVTIWVSTDFMWSDFWFEPNIDTEDEHTKDILKKKKEKHNWYSNQTALLAFCILWQSLPAYYLLTCKLSISKWIDHLCNVSG